VPTSGGRSGRFLVLGTMRRFLSFFLDG